MKVSLGLGMAIVVTVLAENFFDSVNEDVLALNIVQSRLAWKASVSSISTDQLGRVSALRSKLTRDACDKAPNPVHLDASRRRQLYLLCRGLHFTNDQSISVGKILEKMKSIYTESKICIPTNGTYFYENFNDLKWSKPQNESEWLCLFGEPDLERVMAESRQEALLKWTWLAWRQKVGPPIGSLFPRLVELENEVAIQSGYSDIGETRREDFEVNNLQRLCDKLYEETKELYGLLHAVSGHFLKKYYNRSSGSQLIEAHLTGNMWAQAWGPLLDIVLPLSKSQDLNRILRSATTKWTLTDMAKRAEDFYVSLGFSRLNENFWKNSIFSNGNGTNVKCHGTAANMFTNRDYRIIYCGGNPTDDFYVIHHEIGHIQYYMSYDDRLPPIFQDGTNGAIQESIGDAIHLGVMSPQHLQRLGLISDQMLYDICPHHNCSHGDFTFDDVHLLYQGLNKIPHVPFGYLLEKYRWNIFSGDIKANSYNRVFWKYLKKYQGIEPPEGIPRGENYFDAGAKFHVADDSPYVGYFLGGFIQMQIFKGLCQYALYGKVDPRQSLPMPLHRCDIYGSKKAGRKLKEAMSKGSSIDWSEFLYIVTGERTISSTAFMEYFAPLRKFLHNIKVEFSINSTI